MLGRGRDGAEHLGVGVAEQHRTPGADQVDQLVAVHVVQVRPGGPGDEPWAPADGQERTDRRVDPTRDDLPGPLEGGPGCEIVHECSLLAYSKAQ